jgi:TolB-like protein/Flp pilus assembly protein TadD
MDVRRFLAELKGRGVYRVAAIYAAGSWALLQVADLFFPMLGFPDWAITSVLAAAALGFPIAIVLAWLFDITPQGIVETDSVVTNYGRLRLSPARLAELGLLIALICLVAFLYVDRLRPEPRSVLVAENGRPSIAVMPFVNMSDSVEVEYFGDGLAEEILNLLAQLDELNVAARTSSFYFKDRDVDIQQIASHLGVRHVLEGSVRRQGDAIRVTAQLIDARQGFHVWSGTYDRDFDNVFSIQDEIAQSVVDKLQLLLSDNSRQLLQRKTTLDPLAYDYYLQGGDYLRRPYSEDSIGQSIALFEKALALDEHYAAALAGLCRAHLHNYRHGLDSVDFEKAQAACLQALEEDASASSVYIALGDLYRFSGEYEDSLREYSKALEINASAVAAYGGQAETYLLDNKPQLAEEMLQRAIELQPDNWQTYDDMGSFLFLMGRHEEAIPYFRRLTELMPDNSSALNNLGATLYLNGNVAQATEAWQKSLSQEPSAIAYSNVGSGLFFLGRFDEAADMYHKAVEYAPENFEYWGNLGDAYRYSHTLFELAEPMYRNAIKLGKERLGINPSDAYTLSALGHFHASVGERELALQYMAKAEVLAPQDMYIYYYSATTLAALNELDRAVLALEKSIALGYSADMVRVDAGLAVLRDHPDFEALTVQ